MAASSKKRVFNFNVGVLGHVDSGKTSLSKVLSTVASTASFDNNPQSRERGITLDLGFSSFCVDVPDHLQDLVTSYDKIQYTLVDCPGHASLIRTIIGGAQIIDLMLLVVDVTKGMQTQTAECLIIGEITCPRMMVVLNKIDLLPVDKRPLAIEKMRKRMLKTLEGTRFADCPVVAVASKPGGQESDEHEPMAVVELIEALRNNTYIPDRSTGGPFVFAVDHCFSIRGQGVVMTGTVLHGAVEINDMIEIPSINENKKVKSIQMFKQPVERIVQGDRAGICVTQFDPKELERGLVCNPGSLPTLQAAIVCVNQIAYYRGKICSKAKFHITISHETVMGRLTFFGYHKNSGSNTPITDVTNFDFTQEYTYQEELLSKPKAAAAQDEPFPDKQFALIEFEKPVTCPHHCVVIGSKLDTDIHTNSCRIAFHGTLLEGITDVKYKEVVLPKIKIYKTKLKEGQVERVSDEYTVIGKNLFKKETNLQIFTGLKVSLSSGQEGMIEGGFGQSGKIRIRIPNGLPADIVQRFSGTKRKNKGKVVEENTSQDQEPIKIFLSFKRYLFDPEKSLKQL